MHFCLPCPRAAERFPLAGAPQAARRREMLARVHASFSDVVWSRRGDALRRRGLLSRDAACSGEVWTGAEAAANGMVDAVGDLGPVLRDTFGAVRFSFEADAHATFVLSLF
jgi:ClpP class serine protease